jgi:hypothetical protein
MDCGVGCGCQCGVDRERDTSLVVALKQAAVKCQT